MIYKVGRILFDKKVGIVSALLLALSVFHVRHSQEARMYSLLAFLTLLSFYFFAKILKKRGGKTVLLYIISSLFLMYTHVYSLFIIMAQNIIIFTQFILCHKKIFSDHWPRPRVLVCKITCRSFPDLFHFTMTLMVFIVLDGPRELTSHSRA